MAQPNIDLYRVLVHLGTSEDDAKAAAQFDSSNLATKADLLELKADLQRFMVQTIGGMTAIFAFIVGLLKIFG